MKQPPRLADKLLLWFCAPHLLENILGDLHETYIFHADRSGPRKARLMYWREVFGFLKPQYIQRRKNQYSPTTLFSHDMIRHYFKIAFRTLLHNKSYAFINITGLALGLAACIVIFLVVKNELGYDNFHQKADRTYRMTVHSLDYNPSVSFAIAPAFQNDFPEAEASQYFEQNGLVKVRQERYNEKNFAFADERFVEIFDFDWLAGNSETALNEPNTVVLTKSMANKYFGEDQAIGKIIRLDNEYDLRVTGVIRDLPSNTHFNFIFLVSWETIRKQLATTEFWSISGGALYVSLPDKRDAGNVTKRLPGFIRKNWGADTEKGTTLMLQPLREIHFDQRYINQSSMPRSKETIYGLAGVALFIILTACINFVNLATAQALRRAKEVGVRKTLGAYRKQLVAQVMGETTLLVCTSVMLALAAVWLILPSTKSLINIRIEPAQLVKPDVIGTVMAITLITILVAGAYPALVQSGFQPIRALKSGGSEASGKNAVMRKGLVIVQFAITQVLIVGTLVVANQMDFFLNQDMGFDKDAVVSFPIGEKGEVLYQQLSDNPGVEQISYASAGPAYNSNFAPFSSPESGMTEIDVTEMKLVDEHYMPMFKFELIAGEPVTKIFKKDSIIDVVVNQTLIKRLGIQDPQKAIGTRVLIGKTPARIKGVVKDFQSESKHDKIRACLITYNPGGFRQASVKLRAQNMRETLAAIDKDWSALNPESVFAYEFMDEHIANKYLQEEKMYNAFRIFSAIAIIIGCLGLYGLVALMAVQRTKEIGIRKVLGASVPGIVLMFFNQFIWLILIAFVIAAPLGWFVMDKWLQEFAYHIHVGPAIFLFSIAATVIIAGLTISYQSIKAALPDPVKSLRSE